MRKGIERLLFRVALVAVPALLIYYDVPILGAFVLIVASLVLPFMFWSWAFGEEVGSQDTSRRVQVASLVTWLAFVAIFCAWRMGVRITPPPDEVPFDTAAYQAESEAVRNRTLPATFVP